MAISLAALWSGPRLKAQAPATAASTGIPGLLSKAQLDPPLTGRLREMRFSPDGQSLLLQSDSAAYIVGTNPVSMQLNVAANRLLPIRFSADSQEVVGVTRTMQVVRLKIHGGGPAQQRTLGSGGECYAASLSNDGEFYACLDQKSDLRIFRTRTGEQIFDKTIGEPPAMPFPAPAPYHLGLARSEPFGYYLTSSYIPADPAFTAPMVNFSADSRYLLARSLFFQQPPEMIDLQTRKSVGIPKGLRSAAETGSITFVAPDRAITTSFEHRNEANVVSLPDGDIAGKLDFAGMFLATGNPRYAIDVAFDTSGVRLVDLQTDKAAGALSMAGNAVSDKMIASYTQDGLLTLTQLGAEQPFVRARIPAAPISQLRTASVSPDLERIVVAIDGSAGAYTVATGKRIAGFLALGGAWFPDGHTCYLRIPGMPGMGPTTATLQSLDLKTGATSNVGTLQETNYQNENISSGSVLLAHRVKPPVPGAMPVMGGRSFPYEIHALDPANGKELWQRSFEIDPYSQTPSIKSTPVVYTDPQGDRIVLGWGARTPGGKEAADRSATTRNLMKQVKVTDHDAVFEVLDARSGKTIATAFLQTPGGADSFDSVFSEGDWLVIEKGGQTITVLSLSTGEQVAQETGNAPAVSAEAGLLSFAGDAGRFTVIGLKAPDQKREYTFPARVAYSHFSADGKRILVMTDDQTVYLLDAAAGRP